jgi:hypothetical protein
LARQPQTRLLLRGHHHLDDFKSAAVYRLGATLLVSGTPVQARVLEVYNNTLYDCVLTGDSRRPSRRVKLEPWKQHEATQTLVANEAQLRVFAEKLYTAREASAVKTSFNPTGSSRSHLVVMLGPLTIVDLAGSEASAGLDAAASAEQRIQLDVERKHIVQDLTALKTQMALLVHNKPAPFRDRTILRLLGGLLKEKDVAVTYLATMCDCAPWRQLADTLEHVTTVRFVSS